MPPPPPWARDEPGELEASSMPLKSSLRAPHGGAPPSTAPFAVAAGAACGADADTYPADFCSLIHRKRSVADKAGSQGFDMTVYQTNRAANAASVAERRAAAAAAAGPFAVLTPQQAAAAGVSLPYAAPDFHLRSPPKQLPEKIGSAAAPDVDAYRAGLAAQQAARQRGGHVVTQGGSGGGCPFAVDGGEAVAAAWARADYTAKAPGRGAADKIGAERSFDPAVYAAALAANQQTQTTSLQRNFVGGGNILAFEP